MAQDTTVALLGGVRQREGIGRRRTHVTLIGGMDIDLRDPDLPAEGVTIMKVSLVGGVDLKVSADVCVEVSGFTLVGGKDVERVAGASGPVVRVRAFGLFGGVKVRAS